MATQTTAPDPNADPYAWAQWAAMQNPGTYQLTAPQAINGDNLAEFKPALQQAGLWNNAWNDYAAQNVINPETGVSSYTGAIPDLSALSGYTAEQLRGPGSSAFLSVLGPDGKTLGNQSFNQAGSSMKTGDYLTALSTIAAGMGGAYALGGAGAFGAGTAAATDAASSGLGSLAAGTGSGSALLTPAETAALASSVAPSSDAALLAASGAGAGTAADAASLGAITDTATGAPVTQFVTTAAPSAASTAGTSGLGSLAAGTGATTALNAGLGSATNVDTNALANSVSSPDLSNIANQQIPISGTGSSLFSQLGDWAAKNPTTAIKLAGMLGGGLSSLFGGKGNSSSTINSLVNSQNNLISGSKGALNSMYTAPRQVTAPPAGYQGAEDPRGQWDWFNQANNARFFNGIGGLSPNPPNVSIGSNPTSGTGH